MAFFVMLLSFSVQDQEKLNMAAGSVQNAFGIQPYSDMTGMIERKGNPKRDFLKEMAPTKIEGVDRIRHPGPSRRARTRARKPTPTPRSGPTPSAQAQYRAGRREPQAGLAGSARHHRHLRPHHRRADQGRPQHQHRRPGRPGDVPRGEQISLRDDPQGHRRHGAGAGTSCPTASASPATPPPAPPTTTRATASGN